MVYRFGALLSIIGYYLREFCIIVSGMRLCIAKALIGITRALMGIIRALIGVTSVLMGIIRTINGHKNWALLGISRHWCIQLWSAVYPSVRL